MAHPGLAVWRESCVWREGKRHRPAGSRKKPDDHRPGEVREAKTTWLDQMRQV
jgi:hypothetical protein